MRKAMRRRAQGYARGMYERLMEPARRVVTLAEDEARTLRREHIGTEHVLLGLLREREGAAAGVLESLGVGLEDACARAIRIVGFGDEAPAGRIPFTARIEKVLEVASREALELGHERIGQSTSCPRSGARTLASAPRSCSTLVRTTTRSRTRSGA
jgi:ATP-dependent Clp protease ATP-binding subunit ClpA